MIMRMNRMMLIEQLNRGRVITVEIRLINTGENFK